MNTRWYLRYFSNIFSKCLRSCSDHFSYSFHLNGIYVVRSEMGYTVQIDEFSLPYNLSYSDAGELYNYLAALEPKRIKTENR